jgi:hypothetical protein
MAFHEKLSMLCAVFKNFRSYKIPPEKFRDGFGCVDEGREFDYIEKGVTAFGNYMYRDSFADNLYEQAPCKR